MSGSIMEKSSASFSLGGGNLNLKRYFDHRYWSLSEMNQQQWFSDTEEVLLLVH